jgi:hypothetical protein
MQRSIACIAAVLLLGTNAPCAANPDAVLAGQVLYAGNRPASNVTLSVEGPKTTSLQTDQNGGYSLTLPPGDYVIKANGHVHRLHVFPGNNHRIIRLPVKGP